MAERKKLGLIFSNDEHWIGGTYYILNLIHALNEIEDSEKPEIVLLSRDKKDLELAKSTHYPYLSFKNPFQYKRNWVEKIINALYRIVSKKNCIDKRISPKDVDFLFPAHESETFGRIKNKIFWIPDFQHIRYPEYFNEEERNSRNKALRNIASGNCPLVLSSNDAKNDFESIVEEYQCSVHVVPFAVTHPEYNYLDIEKLKKKYDIDKEYFICSNQFWKHKNHPVLIRAIARIVNEGMDIQLVLTGKESDRRNPDYFPGLIKLMEDECIKDRVKLLGLVPRTDQLALMKNALAIIQPSLFEGWSTVVEDAKAMGKYIFVSDIPIHREQIKKNCQFFNPHNEENLSEVLREYRNSKNNQKPVNFYTKAKQKFAHQFLESMYAGNK